jgi:hypothetical protein
VSDAARHSVIHTLRWYQREPGDALIGEATLGEVSLLELQGLFRRPELDPMYDCYPVTPSVIATLQRFVSHRIDLTRYDYFVEANSAS